MTEKPTWSETWPERLSASDAGAMMTAGTLTAEKLARACLQRIAERDAETQAWTYLNPSAVLDAARASDAARQAAMAAGRKLSPLAGIPVGIKDIIDTSDMPTENGTPVFAGRQPKTDAAVVRQLRAAGAIIFGKTVTTELAFFGPGKTLNPANPKHTPGGSSSGSAASVADFQVPLALGTQTAGSIIRPAAYCGSIGFKPTFGYVSRTGVLAQSGPLDTVGGYARTITDMALLIDAISGYDVSDRDMTSGPKKSLAKALARPMKRTPRIAFVKTMTWDQVDAAAARNLEAFAAKLGLVTEVVETVLPSEFESSLRLQQIVQFSDIAKNYGPIADANPHVISDKLKEIIAQGRSFTSADYAAARAEREPLYDALRPVLINYDAILTPAAAGVAPAGLETTGSPMFNALWTYLGMPCISLPLLTCDGLPLGVQLVAARDGDGDLLSAADWMMSEMAKS